jgi:hypothetical protein
MASRQEPPRASVARPPDQLDGGETSRALYGTYGADYDLCGASGA